MVELIVIIFIIVAIVNATSKETKNQKPKTPESNTAYDTAYRAPKQSSYGQEKSWETAARENIEKAARRAGQLANKALNELLIEEESVASPETQTMTAAERIQVRRREEQNTTILQRAKGNVAEKKEDVTLKTMEEEHHHSERVAPAIHHHPEDVIPENMLGTVEDLMVKGYDGNLCFERDFVGEGQDMISRFTI